MESTGGVPGAISTLAAAMQANKAFNRYLAEETDPIDKRENDEITIARELLDEVRFSNIVTNACTSHAPEESQATDALLAHRLLVTSSASNDAGSLTVMSLP